MWNAKTELPVKEVWIYQLLKKNVIESKLTLNDIILCFFQNIKLYLRDPTFATIRKIQEN